MIDTLTDGRQFSSISAVTRQIQETLLPIVGVDIWVKGEISSGRERGGSFYCQLVESDRGGNIIAEIRCTIWNRNLNNIKQQFRSHSLDLQLDNGTTVGFRCSVQYHQRYGLSLNVTDADPVFALGELELRKRQIIEQLSLEGLLDRNKGIQVPVLSQNIGLITGSGSAAYNDFINTLASSRYGFQVLFADAKVQGDETEPTILWALDVLEGRNVDLVVIIRGGGSKTELSALDNEAIARRIASYRLPVWTGIGHEIDTSVLDYVANRYFRTPTAVAEELIDIYT
ncbi:MAG: exodeoxyribonuclease VII large subunit, partial [bacterium]|nr:exodeoxyribonuclease VII large subunit [bacterium]